MATTSAHNLAIQKEAERRLEKGVWNTAEATKLELDRVSSLIAQESGALLVVAGLKDVSSATRKINDECDGHWLDLKDVARVTLAAENEPALTNVIAVLKRILATSEGFTFAKNVQTLPESDPCGYSGFNYVVRFGPKPVSAALPTGPQKPPPLLRTTPDVAPARPAPVVPLYVGRFGEIQVNTYDMMYAKMSRKQFEGMFDKAKWKACHIKSGIEGGVGHLFYEDWRVDKDSERGRYVAELSSRYYRRMRGTDPKPAGPVDQLREEVDAYLERSDHDAGKYKKGPDGRWIPA